MKIHTDIKKILVPVSLMHDYATPLKQAIYFHEVYGSSIVLLNVVPDQSIFHRILRPEKLEKKNKKAQKKLKKIVKQYFNGKLPEYLSLLVVNGGLISGILKAAEQTRSDLIIIKKAKRIRTTRIFGKENADRLIAEAICPVLTMVDKPTDQGIKNIMIPVDITKKSTNKVAWAISLGKQFNASLHIVSVQNLDIPGINSLSYKKSLRIEETIKKAGLDVYVSILKANKKSMEAAVLDHAAEVKPDMFLIMTHQESILFDNYLSNFASEIIHKSPIPVFSVVPRKETLIDGFMGTSRFRKRQLK